MSSSFSQKGSLSNIRVPSYDLFPKISKKPSGLIRSNTIGARPVMSQPRKITSHGTLPGPTNSTTATLLLSHPSSSAATTTTTTTTTTSRSRSFSLRRHKSQNHKKPPFASPPVSMRSPPVPCVPTETVRVFVGPEQQEFIVNRAALCACSPFFRDHLSLGTAKLSLPTETPAMFELFSIWLHQPAGFHNRLAHELDLAEPQPGRTVEPATASSRLHWTLVRLHLYAAVLELMPLQDLAMDAIQDLYRRREWDITPRFVRFLYSQCDPVAAMRLRRWAVAMVAYCLACHTSATPLLSGSGTGASQQSDADKQRDATAFYQLLAHYPEFQTDYTVHLRKMAASGLNLSFKNPQLRIPSNALCNDQRRYAFRQCAFHTHRATAGHARCLYGGDEDIDSRQGLIWSRSRRVRHAKRQADLIAELETQRVCQEELEKQQKLEALATVLQQEHEVLRDRESGRTFNRTRTPVQHAPPVPAIDHTAPSPYGHIRSVSDTTGERPRSRRRSQSRSHGLTGIPESPSGDDEEPTMATTLNPPIPPMPFTTHSSPSSPQSARTTLVRNRENATSYTSSVYSHITITDAPPIPAILRAGSFPLNVSPASTPSPIVPMVETPSTSPPPYLRYNSHNLTLRPPSSRRHTPSNTSAISRSACISRSPIDGPAPPSFSTPTPSTVSSQIGVANTTDIPAPASSALGFHSHSHSYISPPPPLNARSLVSNVTHGRSMSSSPAPRIHTPNHGYSSSQSQSQTPRKQPPILTTRYAVFPATPSSRPGTASPMTASAPPSQYQHRKLPARPSTASQSSSQEPSPVYRLNTAGFDFDEEIQSLQAVCPPTMQGRPGYGRTAIPDDENPYGLDHGAVDHLLDEVAIALQNAQTPMSSKRGDDHGHSQSSIRIATAF